MAMLRDLYKKYVLNRTYKGLPVKKFKVEESDSFKKSYLATVDKYFDEVKKYIYHNIEITDYTKGNRAALQSRVQMVVSQVLLRSLMLKNGAVENLNKNNFPAYHAILKSFMETFALMGYLAYTLKFGKNFDEKIETVIKLGFGNKGMQSEHEKLDPVGVKEMFLKTDKFIKQTRMSNPKLNKKGKKQIETSVNMLTQSYIYMNDFSHANYSAHWSVGLMDVKTGIWKLKDGKSYKKSLWPIYLPDLVSGINLMPLLCESIEKNKDIQEYDSIENKRLF